jgi:Ca-activated chloride channel family protein
MADVDVDERTLATVAQLTGGKFYRATDTDSLRKIYDEINRLEKTAQTELKFERVAELYRWAVIPALGVLALAFVLEHTLYRRLP